MLTPSGSEQCHTISSKWLMPPAKSQSPATLVVRDGVLVKTLDRNRGQKWLRLGCMFPAAGSLGQNVALCPFFTTAAVGYCKAEKLSLLRRLNILTVSRLQRYVSPVATAQYAKTWFFNVLKLDVAFRKLCLSIVAPPSDTDLSLEWHNILHN